MTTVIYLLALLNSFRPSETVECRIVFENLKEAKGSLFVAVYAAESDFLNTQRVYAQQIVPVRQSGSITLSFPGLPAGQYAISCFHDVNGNGALDTNLVGIPTEPYGFSNNARPKFRAPKWQETVFQLSEGAAPQKIQLDRW